MDLTLEDSTTEKVPLLLNKLVERILSHTSTSDLLQKDLLLISIIVLMIENGFQPLRDDYQILDPETAIGVELLSKWKSSSGFYKLMFVFYPFENMPIKFIMSPLGATVIVNMVIESLNYDTYTVCLPISRYVVSPQASTVPMIFRDLKHMSCTLKNKVLSAVKSKVLSHHGYPSASLMGLPEEVLFKLAFYLSISDIIALTKTCKRLNFLLENNSLWHKLFKRDYDEELKPEKNNWKELYKDVYKTQPTTIFARPASLAGTMHDFMDYSDFVSYIDNPLWDIVI